jgi:uncharacterized phage protein (TIGR02218 family)
MVYEVTPRAVDHLKLGEVRRIARCWKLTRRDGAVRRFTNHSHSIEAVTSFDPYTLETFSPANGANRESFRRQVGASPDSDTIKGFISTSGWTSETARIRLFEDCRVDILDVDWRFPFAGDFYRCVFFMVDVQWSGEEIEFRLSTISQRAVVAVGRFYDPRCDATLYDSRCGINPAGFSSGTRTVTAIPSGGNPRLIFDSNNTAQADTFWQDGDLTWLTGNNATTGINVFQVKGSKQADGRMQLWTPTPYDIEVGDTFSVTAGCNHLLGQHCHPKFANSENHRGFPQLPGYDKIMKPQDSKI